MRISTLMLHRQGVDNMLRQQAALAETQNQIATGKRLPSAAANPADWSRAAGLDQTLAALQNYQANAATAAERLGYEDNALASASEILFRARELAVQVNSATLDDASRSLIVSQLQGLRQELLDVANQQDGEGRYLFAGSNSAGAPFTLAGSSASYAGDQNARLLQLSAHRSLADGDNGYEVFQNLRSGNGHYSVAAAGTNTGTAALTATSLPDSTQWDGGSYTLSFSGGTYEVRDAGNALVSSGAYASGAAISFRGIQLSFSGAAADGDQFSVGPSAAQDMFATLQQLVDFAQAPASSTAQRARNQTQYFGALQALDAAQTHLADLRGSVGSRLSSVEESVSSLSAQSLLAEQHLSELRDLDYAEAASRLSLQQTLLQAAQLSYQRVQGLSLFEYLR